MELDTLDRSPNSFKLEENCADRVQNGGLSHDQKLICFQIWGAYLGRATLRGSSSVALAQVAPEGQSAPDATVDGEIIVTARPVRMPVAKPRADKK